MGTADHGRRSEMKLFGRTSTVKDPVCGMAVDPEKARASTTHEGTTHYFCSPKCKEVFDREPMAYMAGAGRTKDDGKGHDCC
jgi:Cu+-exporting ATPase